jgi:hypothetical protein
LLELLALINDSGILLSIISVPVSLFFTFEFFGMRQTMIEIGAIVVAALAFVVSLTAFMLICAIRAAVMVPKEISNTGLWHGKTFVFHEPRRILTRIVSPAEAGQHIYFSVPEAVPGSFVQMKVKFENRHYKGCIASAIAPLVLSNLEIAEEATYGVTLDRKRQAILVFHVREDATPTSARVYILSWGGEVGPT